MRKIFFLILTLWVKQCTYGQPTQILKIGLISDGLSPSEKIATVNYLKGIDRVKFTLLTVNNLEKNDFALNGIKEIWWMKDSENITSNEIIAGNQPRKFVENGGHLILSMEAVKFLNEWGIEKNKFDIKEDSVIDEGFGRPLGFHGYLEHPIYYGLHGGAYIWKGVSDHVVRKIGFFGNDLPDTSICKVIGVGWSYITFHEDEKLVLEYRLGKGSIIAIGAYTYFSRPNLNKQELYKFYQNIIYYSIVSINKIRKGYWDYRKKEVREINTRVDNLKIAKATRWRLPELSLELKRKIGGKNFVNLAGRRMLLMDKEQGGIEEVWTHPFMAFRDILTAIKVKGRDSLIWLNRIESEIIVSPEMIIRKYKIGNSLLSEVITVAFDKPIGVIHYEWTGNDILKLYVKFTSNLRMMWPYSDTSSPIMSYQWCKQLCGVMINNEHAGSGSIIGFSNQPDNFILGQYKNFAEINDTTEGQPSELLQVSGCFSFGTRGVNQKFNVYLVGMDKREGDMVKLYRHEMPGFNSLYLKSSTYYKKLLKSQLTITTPNQVFNDGYKWAMVRTDQFLQSTPEIGTSMMAGFGTTARGWDGGQRVSGRPGYAWYFGRDGEWTAMALDAIGKTDETKKVLEMFVKYQAVNGKIFHELTSSGAVHYDASDATPLFVILAGNYLKYSGDLEYIKKIWPSIKKALDFCYSTDTDHDGLIENTNVGHGWIEGGPLFGPHTEFYLAGCWAAALDEAAYMCRFIGDIRLMNKYASEALFVKQTIDQSFWSESEKHFYNGKMLDGSYMKDATVLQTVPIYLNAVTDTHKAYQALIPFSKSDFSTDWGIRMISDNNPKFNPGSYHSGMVWPLFSGYASLAEYKTGRFTSGFVHLMDNISGFNSWAMGSIVETLNGKQYKPNGVCYLQGWSETMCMQPAIEGMLGYKPDMMSNIISLSPAFPVDWDSVKVNKFRFGTTNFEMQFRRYGNTCSYNFSKKDNKNIQLDFSPVLPLGTTIESVYINGNPVKFEMKMEEEGVRVRISTEHFVNHLQIDIKYKGGAGIVPIVDKAYPEQSNVSTKVIFQKWNESKLLLKIQGLSESKVQFILFSAKSPQKIDGGIIKRISSSLYRISLYIPRNGKKWNEQQLTVTYQP